MSDRALFEEALRRFDLGSVRNGTVVFDWSSLAVRRLVLVPLYEHDARVLFDALTATGPVEYESSVPGGASSDGMSADAFAADLWCTAHWFARPAGDVCFVGWYTEEGYLAVTPEAAERAFGETAVDLLARSLLRCLAEQLVWMRRHRHGRQIFMAAVRHLDSLELPWPESVVL